VLAAGLFLLPEGPYAREPMGGVHVQEVVSRSPRLLLASSMMPLGELRLPPPGYVDYCLRFKGRDQGCVQ
jgi:hypothetical protein